MWQVSLRACPRLQRVCIPACLCPGVFVMELPCMCSVHQALAQHACTANSSLRMAPCRLAGKPKSVFEKPSEPSVAWVRLERPGRGKKRSADSDDEPGSKEEEEEEEAGSGSDGEGSGSEEEEEEEGAGPARSPGGTMQRSAAQTARRHLLSHNEMIRNAGKVRGWVKLSAGMEEGFGEYTSNAFVDSIVHSFSGHWDVRAPQHGKCWEPEA